MKVFQDLRKLSQPKQQLFFRKAPLFLLQLFQRLSFQILHNDTNIALRLKDIVNPRKSGMIQMPGIIQLPSGPPGP